jgi:hypothetical protein
MLVRINAMQASVRVRTIVLPGHRIEVAAPELTVGDAVEVLITSPSHVEPTAVGTGTSVGDGESILDILNALPGGRMFKTSQEVDRYIREERDSWDR